MSPEQAELPDPSEKKANMKDAFKRLISNNVIKVTPKNREEILGIAEDPPVMNAIDDSEPCKGRKCLACQGCPSFNANVSEVKELMHKATEDEDNEDEDDTAQEPPPRLEAAGDAINHNMKDMVNVVNDAKAANAKLSRWDFIKCAQRSIKSIMKVDIFEIKKKIRRFADNIDPKDRVDMKKDDWDTIRNFFILNGLDWWLDDITTRSNKHDDKKFTLLYAGGGQGRTYADGKMLVVQMVGTEVTDPIAQLKLGNDDLLKALGENVRNSLLATQMAFHHEVRGLVAWNVAYNQ